MNAYTISSCEVYEGIRLSEAGQIVVGEEGRGRKLVLVPCSPKAILAPDGDKMLGIDSPKVVILIRDHSGYRGTWHTQLFPESKVKIIAEGRCAQGIAGRVGGGPELLLLAEPGAKIEIIREGRLYGAPKRLLITVDEQGEVTLADLERQEGSAAAAAAWED
jgi:hypothetical protein